MLKMSHCPYLIDLLDGPEVKRVTIRKGTSVGATTSLELWGPYVLEAYPYRESPLRTLPPHLQAR